MCSSSLPMTTRARSPSDNTSRSVAVTPNPVCSGSASTMVRASLRRTTVPGRSVSGFTFGEIVSSMRRPEVMTSAVSMSELDDPGNVPPAPESWSACAIRLRSVLDVDTVSSSPATGSPSATTTPYVDGGVPRRSTSPLSASSWSRASLSRSASLALRDDSASTLMVFSRALRSECCSLLRRPLSSSREIWATEEESPL